MTIIRGTTPTIKYTFRTIEVGNIAVAILTVSQSGEVVIEKNIAAGMVGEDNIFWTLTQLETLSLKPNVRVEIRLNWKLQDGTRGASKRAIVSVEDNEISEVI